MKNRKIVDYVLVRDDLKSIKSSNSKLDLSISELRNEIFKMEEYFKLSKSDNLVIKQKLDWCDYFLNLETDKEYKQLDSVMRTRLDYLFKSDFIIWPDFNYYDYFERVHVGFLNEYPKIDVFPHIIVFLSKIINAKTFVVSQIDKEQISDYKNKHEFDYEKRLSYLSNELEEVKTKYNTLIKLKGELGNNEITFFQFQIKEYSERGYELQGGFFVRDYIGYQAMVKYED
jgi:hypothetical protein